MTFLFSVLKIAAKTYLDREIRDWLIDRYPERQLFPKVIHPYRFFGEFLNTVKVPRR